MSNIHGLSFNRAEKKKDEEELTQVGSSNSATSVFRPTGAKPTGSSSSNDPMADIIAQAKGQSAGGQSGASDRNIGLITIYANGFIIGNGEFRPLSDPKNASFIAELKRGEVPSELEAICRKEWGSQFNEFGVNLVDKSNQTFEPPKPKFDFSTSQGQSLVSSSSSSSASSAAAFKQAKPARVNVDNTQPTTTIQIILSDRKKVKESFNHSHTVLQVYEHIMSLSGIAGFELVAGFPPKALLNPQQTVKEAGLLGASIQQR